MQYKIDKCENGWFVSAYECGLIMSDDMTRSWHGRPKLTHVYYLRSDDTGIGMYDHSPTYFVCMNDAALALSRL